MTRVRFILLLAALLAGTAFARDDSHFDLPTEWEGHIHIRELRLRGREPVRIGGGPIRISFNPNGRQEFGAIYYPEWGATTWPITRLKLQGDSIEFHFGPDESSPGVFSGTVTDNQNIRGTYTWKGKKYLFALGLPGTLDKPLRPRPQIPQFPFPYRQERVAFKSGNITISALLLVPQKVRRYSAVVQIGGSEPRAADSGVPGDPDPNIWHWVLADYLARAGIVSLRMDSRGMGESGGKYDDSTLDDLAADAACAVEYLRTRPDINRRRVGLLGHSRGATVAPMAANLNRSADFVILLAGSGIPLDDLVLNKRQKFNEPWTPIVRDRQLELEFNRRLFELCKSNMSTEQITEEMLKFKERVSDPVKKLAFQEKLVRQHVATMTTPMFRSRLRHDPSAQLRGLRQTVLVMAADKDLLCPPDVTIPAIENALNDGINWSKSIKVWPDLSHSFTKTTNGIDATTNDIIDPDVLFHIADWIWQRPRRW